jgi:hydrogenase-4 component E
MSGSTYRQLLDLFAAVALVAAVLVLWRRRLGAIVVVLAAQGAALGAVAVLVGLHHHEFGPVATGIVALVLKAVVIPVLVWRVVAHNGDERETDPVVNVAAALVAATALVVLAFAVTPPLVSLAPSPETEAMPIGFAIMLVAGFALVTRRKAVSQIVGFLMLENGVSLVALLVASGVPVVVELGVALDALLVVLVLVVLTTRMQAKFGRLDLELLRELHD